MPALIDVRAKAKEHQVKEGETLETIARDEQLESWELLARYNFGTTRPREVLRAIVETIGVKTADLGKIGWVAAPQSMPLVPDADLPTPKLKIPVLWKKDAVTLEKTTKITVKPLPTPATAVTIHELDKWFIPQEEECRIEYGLEGAGATADKLVLDVYGSKYCDATGWSNGLGTYGDPATLADKPLFTLDLAAEKQAEEREDYGMPKDKEWKGAVTATDGILARTKWVNVAFSPYTAHFRYWKGDGQKDARIVLQPFWPEFEDTKAEPAVTPTVGGGSIALAWTNADDVTRGVVEVSDKAGYRVHVEAIGEAKLKKGAQTVDWDKRYRAGFTNTNFAAEYLDDAADAPKNSNAPYVYKVTTYTTRPKPDSLKIKWTIKNTTTLERGQLQITDGKGKVVFHKPLPKAKLGQGDQELAWDGEYAKDIKNSKDGTKVIAEDAPYRVQIQANTGVGVAEGLALAAMHTEVRLYVHPETKAPKNLLYDGTAKPSFLLEPGPLVPGTPPADTDGTKWYQHQLALAGFHPGPINGTAGTPFNTALKEFKRSVPKHKTGLVYERLTIDENEDADTKAAIQNLRGTDRRRPFGDPARVAGNNDDPNLSDDDYRTWIADPAREIVVWVDDRQYYTTGDAKDDANVNYLTGTPAAVALGLADYRGGMEVGDGKTDTDANAIPRPWVPLKAELRLLSRDKGLTDTMDAIPDDDKGRKLRAAMRTSIGPLRVDWTFDELPLDVSTINPGAYDSDFTRSRRYVAWAIRGNQSAYARKDTGATSVYTNAKAGLGGLRPDALAGYYKEAFGVDDESLAPWRATAVSATETVATVVHEKLVAAQTADTDLFEPLIGAAGAWFVPSRIAGDGYRVRAEVQFEKFAGYEFPNLDALKARYPIPPQAHTAKLRVWRRSSMRGYMCWAGGGTGHWTGLVNGFRNHYKTAHVYFVHEGGAAHEFAINTVFDPGTPGHVTRYKNVIKNNVDPALGDLAKITLRANDIWPWGDQADYGWPWPSNEGVTDAQLYDNWLNTDVIELTWRAFRTGLLLALVKEAEKQGYLRGHMFVEFEAGPSVDLVQYECDDAAAHKYWFLEGPGGANRADGDACPAPGPCAGTLAPAASQTYGTGLPLPAVGIALGATWLFTTSDADTWAHEVGHHRHAEHAASAPGARPDSHDSSANTTRNWVTLGVADADKQQWDRNCVMSYSSSEYPGGTDHFCGRCILKNRGWKVTGLGFPDGDLAEP